MSIFRKLRQWNEIRHLKQDAWHAPSPGTIGTLAERYIALGRTEDAHQVAEDGMRFFPTSERLQAVRTFAKKQKLQTEIQNLRRELGERPTPAVFSRLATIYRDLGKFDQALSICQECIERFPLNENPYLITGEVRLARFFQDLIAFDGMEAERQLRRVVKLNSQNLKAHLLLAQIYYSVGALDLMRSHLETAIGLSPDSRELVRFREEIDSRPAAFATALAPSPRDGDEDEDEEAFEDEDETEVTVSELIRSVETRRAFRNRPESCPAFRLLSSTGSAPTARLDVENLKTHLKEIGARPGVTNAIIVDRDGETLAEMSEADALTRKQFSELVTEIQRTSEEASRRMDVGTFHWCTVEGDFGGLTITRVKNISLGLKYGASVRADRTPEMLKEFAARNFTAEPEVTRA